MLTFETTGIDRTIHKKEYKGPKGQNGQKGDTQKGMQKNPTVKVATSKIINNFLIILFRSA